MYLIITANENIGRKYGADYRTSSPMAVMSTQYGSASVVVLEKGETISADLVISNAEIHHTKMKLLPAEARSYKKSRISLDILFSRITDRPLNTS